MSETVEKYISHCMHLHSAHQLHQKNLLNVEEMNQSRTLSSFPTILIFTLVHFVPDFPSYVLIFNTQTIIEIKKKHLGMQLTTSRFKNASQKLLRCPFQLSYFHDILYFFRGPTILKITCTNCIYTQTYITRHTHVSYRRHAI